jgi:hypothetical protein
MNIQRQLEECKCGKCADCNLARLEKENDRLKRLCRYQFLTLGFYAAKYNYTEEAIVHHPITGEPEGGIMADGGEQARAAKKVREKLGFTTEEILAWPGPG